jgi:hypothetical protein
MTGRTQEEIARRKAWAIEQGFSERNAGNYAAADPEDEEDWQEWLAARNRAAEKMAQRIAEIFHKVLDN